MYNLALIALSSLTWSLHLRSPNRGAPFKLHLLQLACLSSVPEFLGWGFGSWVDLGLLLCQMVTGLLVGPFAVTALPSSDTVGLRPLAWLLPGLCCGRLPCPASLATGREWSCSLCSPAAVLIDCCGCIIMTFNYSI